ncbi:hypothetical protein B5F40_06035 [Gordonibacter sp. An230]|uniref:XdhC family protein n=1 Tax=Gordonibacter sp. An230 TaxID=1965592 RepID=UPI000B36B0A6|nr:XdhC/CoxI family protein [Gordonibacter sp. An230]OUO90746.1 hypothetical protein B5F40_06035 [Gordonibacter sp. An230]
MREVAEDVLRWLSEGEAVALAQVVRTWGSSPRLPGSVMAVSGSGRIAGSVSGGCIEAAVARIAVESLEAGRGSLEEFRASTASARQAGLSCGGSVEVLVSPLDPGLFHVEAELARTECEYVRASVLRDCGDAPTGTSFIVAAETDAEEALDRCGDGGIGLAHVPGEGLCVLMRSCGEATSALEEAAVAVTRKAAERPRFEESGVVEHGGSPWFFVRRSPQPQLVCVGGVHIAIHLCRMAKALGYRTVVVDPRRVFATAERFPFVDELVHAWPQEAFGRVRLTERTALCALTHDPKIDVPALASGLESQAFYLGSLGRPSTQLSRARQLAALGYGESALARVFGPIGLDLKGREPAEIALSIMAEITAVRHGGQIPMSTMEETARREAACSEAALK